MMRNIAKESSLTPDEVLGEAVAFFGPGGVGLAKTECGEGCLRFEGGGGYVQIQVTARGSGSQVEILEREWTFQVDNFLDEI
jgi:hypothetical protein